jgi:hypothetical protein
MPDRRRFSSRVSLLERVASMRKGPGATLPARAPAPAEEHDRLGEIEARLEHLEAALEGLQDAVHRDSVRHDESIAELQRALKPDAMARALSADARRRGL